ncbi:hypothetical protein, partial [uncultured Alistipes sp.]|uniref:hypothetical protein n=1 Tax=uncultured Alistipes sp. TaxID=538949 RepID=UPI0032203D6C
QLGEHLLCKQGVKGSTPFISTVIIFRADPDRKTGQRRNLFSDEHGFMGQRKHLENYHEKE